jgi:hypothetical protein
MPSSTINDGAISMASLQVELEGAYPTIIFCLVLTLVWGYLWANVIRDEEKQRLPPSFAAKMFFALSLCTAYIALVMVGFLAPDILQNLNLPGMSDVVEAVRKQIPLLAIIVMGALYSIPQVKEIAERYTVLLHSAQYRKNDEIVLQRHLQSCEFDPSEAEIVQNIDYVRQFDVYITDRDNTALNLETVGAWRKVSSLLRMLEDEARKQTTVLTAKEREDVARFAEAHRRKTQLAMNIIRMIDQMDVNANVDQKLTRIASQLSDVSHSDRAKVVSAEEIAREIVSQLDIKAASNDISRPLRLSMRQMNEYLSQIERYFMSEYQLILGDVAKLAAKIIMRAGDRATDRLETVKAAGFAGLGRIERVSLDSVLWVLLTTFVFAFGGLTLLMTLMGRPMNTSLITSISLTVSMGALIGTMWGARRSLAERQATPWSSYISAGLMAVAGFCLIHSVRFLLTREEMLARLGSRFDSRMQSYRELGLVTREQAAYYSKANVLEWNLLDYLWQTLPWSLSVFFLTVGLCWLARLPEWPWQRGNPVVERFSDGIAVGFIYVAGGLASVIAHIALKTGSGLNYMERIATEKGTLWVFFGNFRLMSFVIGFAIGAIIVREVRRIAHAKLIAPVNITPRKEEKRREEKRSEEKLPQAEERLAIAMDVRKAS